MGGEEYTTISPNNKYFLKNPSTHDPTKKKAGNNNIQLQKQKKNRNKRAQLLGWLRRACLIHSTVERVYLPFH